MNKTKTLIKTLLLTLTLCICFIGVNFISDAKSAECVYLYDSAFEVLDYLNAERAKAGLSALKLDQSLTNVAMTRASELTIKYDHYRPDGTYFTSAGSSSWLKSENIAYGYNTPKEANTAWTNSPPHYKAMTGNFTGVGIGCVQAADGTFYWTEEFGVYRSAAKQKENYSTISAKNMKVTISTIANKASGVKLTWKSASGADGYYIYRKQSGGSYKKIKKISNSSKTSYTDKTVKIGKKYSYKVLPYTKRDGKTGKCSAQTVVYQKKPTISSVSCNGYGEVTVKWKKVSGISGYRISYSNSSSFKYTNFAYAGKNKSKAEISIPSDWDKVYVKVATYVNVKSDVRCYSPTSKVLSAKVTKKKLSAPIIKNAVSKQTGKATVSWSPVDGADEYRVYYSTDKNFGDGLWHYTAGKDATSYNVPGLTSGKTYYFKVAAVNTEDGRTIKSEYSDVISAKIK